MGVSLDSPRICGPNQRCIGINVLERNRRSPKITSGVGPDICVCTISEEQAICLIICLINAKNVCTCPCGDIVMTENHRIVDTRGPVTNNSRTCPRNCFLTDCHRIIACNILQTNTNRITSSSICRISKHDISNSPKKQQQSSRPRHLCSMV